MPYRQTHRFTPEQEQQIVAKYLSGTVSIDDLGRQYGFLNSPSTLYRVLRTHGVEPRRGRPGTRVATAKDHAVPAALTPKTNGTNGTNGVAAAAEGARLWRVVVEVEAPTAHAAVARVGPLGDVSAVEMVEEPV